MPLQSAITAAFPAFGALVAAAASIAKARCEVDAAAATAAAAEIASSKTDTTSLPRNPLRATGELVRLTFRGTLGSQGSVRGSVRRLSPRKWLRKLGKRGVTVDAEAVDADDELSQDILGFKANDRDDGASLLG